MGVTIEYNLPFGCRVNKILWQSPVSIKLQLFILTAVAQVVEVIGH